jgi:serine/threonine-protein kinase
VFRNSVLLPLDLIRAAIARAETGESVELVLDRKDELGRIARSFNTMVAALARSRAALRDRIVELESSQREVEILNEELRRQVAARSRHLAQVLPQVERFEETIGIGSLVDGRYRVEERLGEGAMGVVFGVRRMSDHKPLALKTILGGSQDDAIRFTREAEIAATIDHRNIVSVIDVGMHLGTPYFVMERLSGGALSAMGARFGDLPWVLPILRQIAEGLEDLQARGILHRDLKPANVLLDGDTERPVAKISDLGIARSNLADALAETHDLGSGERRIAETAPSALVGTFPYMAPELAQGASAYTAASDVFSFGVLAWEVATGALPYRVPPVFAVLAGERLADPLHAFEAAHDLEALLRRCLRQDVDARPTIADIVEALARLAPLEHAAAGGLGA